MTLLDGAFEVVEVVSDGAALIRRTDELRPDLVVTDIGLDGLNGILATAVVRARHPSLPIVIITAYLDAEFRSDVLAAGASAFLQKSRIPEELRSLLQAFFPRGSNAPQ